MKNIKISLVMLFVLLVSVESFAQRGRGRNYKPYQYNRNQVTVHVGPRYNYRPAYRPYYRPNYRPAYRSVYRSPRAYVHYGPVFGVRVNVLPYGYNRIFVGPDPYYYNNGIYYRPYNNQYEVVAPPLHATVKKLPADAVVTIIDGQKYYHVGDTFYQEEMDEKNRLRYRVVGTDGVINTGVADDTADLNAMDDALPVVGDRFDQLPAGSAMQLINEQKYFVSPSGVYYKEVIEGNNLRYEVTTVQ